MYEKIAQSIQVLRTEGFSAYLFMAREYLKRILVLTPIFRTIAYAARRVIFANPYFIQNVQGSKMFLDSRDNGLCRELFIHNGLREPECTRIFQSELREGMVVVDIGANIGYYLLMEALRVGSGGRVYGIEPAPRNFALLEKNVALNAHPAPVELVQLAIADKSGTAPLYMSAHWNRNSLHNMQGIQRSHMVGKVEVAVSTLDEFMQGKRLPDMVRMDVEGFEIQILRGMKSILSGDHPMKLYIEVHPTLIAEAGESVEGMLTDLASYGFSISYLVRDELDVSPQALARGLYAGPIAIAQKAYRYSRPIRELLSDSGARKKLLGEKCYCYGLFLEK